MSEGRKKAAQQAEPLAAARPQARPQPLHRINTKNCSTTAMVGIVFAPRAIRNLRGAGGKPPWSKFTMHIIDVEGSSALAIRRIYSNNEQDRDAVLRGLAEKFKQGTVWIFNAQCCAGSGFKPVKHDPTWNAQNTPTAFDFGPNLRAEESKESAEDFPAAPRCDLKICRILAIEKERRINVIGVVRKVEGPSPQECRDGENAARITRLLTKVELVDEMAQMSATVTLWQDPSEADGFANRAGRLIVGEIVAFCNMALRMHNRGKTISSTDEAEIVRYEYETPAQPRVKELLKIVDNLAEQEITSSATTAVESEVAKGPLRVVCVQALLLSTLLRVNFEENAFALDGVTVDITETDEAKICAGSDGRLFVPATLSDCSGSAEVRLTEKAALAIATEATREDFLEKMRRGTLRLMRGNMRVTRTIKELTDGKVVANLVVVDAAPCIFPECDASATDPTNYKFSDSSVFADGSGVIPAWVSKINPTSFGGSGVEVGMPGRRVHEARGGALVLVKATSDSEVEQTASSVVLVSKKVQGIEPPTDVHGDTKICGESDDYEYQLSGFFPLALLLHLGLHAGDKALIRVTDVRRSEGPPKKCELTYSDCWKINDMSEEDAIERMKTEITVASLVCQRRRQLRRKGSTVDADDSQEIVQVFTPSAKRCRRYSDSVTGVTTVTSPDQAAA